MDIIEWCRENGNPLPEWNVRTGSVLLTFKPLPDRAARQPESQLWSQIESQLGSQLESLRNRVINMLSKEMLSKSEISRRLGQKRTSGQLNKVMKELIAEGIVAFSIHEKPASRLQKYQLIKKTTDKDQ